MLSIIITAWDDPFSTKKCIQNFLDEKISEDYEILVSTPFEKTKKIVREFSKKYPKKFYLLHQPEEMGKNQIYNLLFKKAKGSILIMTDGNKFIKKGSVKKILKSFGDESVGCVGGRPVSNNKKDYMV
ncbi:MAG: glycosyltransferase, partial [Nanoarchaeota archaeon]